jgi:hypothetical protein
MDQSREAGREQAHLVTLAETLAPTLAPTLASTLDLTNFAVAFGYRSKRLFHLPRTVNAQRRVVADRAQAPNAIIMSGSSR